LSGPPSHNVSPLKKEDLEGQLSPAENGGKKPKRRHVTSDSSDDDEAVLNGEDLKLKSKMKLVKKKLLNKLKKTEKEVDADEKISASGDTETTKGPKTSGEETEDTSGKVLGGKRLRKRSAKQHSGEFKGLDGGSNNNISTKSEEQHHDSKDVAETSGKNIRNKSKKVAVKNSPETKKTEKIGRNVGADQEGEAASDADVEDEADDKASNGVGKVKDESANRDQEYDSDENLALASRSRKCRKKAKNSEKSTAQENAKPSCKKENVKAESEVMESKNQPALKPAKTTKKCPDLIQDKDKTKSDQEPLKAVTKKAIILPIMSKHHKEAMLKAKMAAAAVEEKPAPDLPAVSIQTEIQHEKSSVQPPE